MSDTPYIDDLILRFLRGVSTPGEEAELARRRRFSAENEDRFRRLERLWQVTEAALPRAVETNPPSTDALIAAAEAPESERTPAAADSEVPSVRGGPPRRRRRALATTAAAAVITALAFGLGTFTERARSGLDSLEATEVTTGAGELTTVTLSDGTAVRVGPQSRLQVFREGETRIVQLDGRAFFSVASDRARQFVVRTRYGDATALGTRFEVRTERLEFRVLVVEGSVRVSAEGADVDMGAGMMSRSADGERPTTTWVEDPNDLLDWMGRTLMFRSTRLGEVVAEIEREYGVEVDLVDPRLLDFAVTATFTDQELESVVSVICGIIGAECSVDADSVRIEQRIQAAAPNGPGHTPYRSARAHKVALT